MKAETKAAKMAIIEERKAKLSNEQITRYKEMATTRYDRMKYTQEYMGVLFNLANEYIVECERKGKHMTIAGLQRALGINSKSWYRMRNGDMDHALYEFLAQHDLPEDYADTLETMVWEEDGKQVPLITYSEFLDNLYLRQQELLEEVCINKSNPIGAIFLMKSMHQIRDDSSGVTINNNTLNVYQDKFGSLEEIERARKLLG